MTAILGVLGAMIVVRKMRPGSAAAADAQRPAPAVADAEDA